MFCRCQSEGRLRAEHGQTRSTGGGRASLAASDAGASDGGDWLQDGSGQHASPSGGGDAFMPTEEQLPGQPQRAPKRPPAKCASVSGRSHPHTGRGPAMRGAEGVRAMR